MYLNRDSYIIKSKKSFDVNITNDFSYNSSLKIKKYVLVNKVLNDSFLNTLVLLGKVTIDSQLNKEIITVCYYTGSNNNIVIELDIIISLSKLLSYLLNKNVVLRIIKVKYPHSDPLILAKLFALNFQKYKSLKSFNKLLLNIPIVVINKSYKNKNVIPYALRGISLTISGPIDTEIIIPRKTTKTFSYGAFKNINQDIIHIIDKASYTSLSKYGIFTVKVILAIA